MAKLALSVAGAAIGSAFGQPSLGWSIGSLLGGALFPDKLPDVRGPTLSDLRVQQSTYGAMIPLLFGEMRMAGQVLWSTPKIPTEHTEEQGGKGGPTQNVTTTTYSASFAVAICDGEILGIRKIFGNANLIRNIGDTADTNTIIASNSIADGIRIYTGTEDQEADSLIAADVGIDNCPAFRGTAYVVFENLQLEPFNNNLPNIENQVIAHGSEVGLRIVEDTYDLDEEFATDEGAALGKPIVFEFASGVVRVGVLDDPDIVYLYNFHGDLLATESRNANEALFEEQDCIGIWNGDAITVDILTDLGSLISTGILKANDVPLDIDIDEYLGGAVISQDGGTLMLFTAPASVTGGDAIIDKWYQLGPAGSIVDQGTVDPPLDRFALQFGRASGFHYGSIALENDLKHVWLVYGASSHPIRYYSIDDDGNFAQGEQLLDVGGGETLPPDFVYPSIAADNGVAAVIWHKSLITFTRTPSPSATAEPLADIVTALCLKAGLTEDQIDVSLLTDLVDGYAVSRIGNGRVAIETLMTAFYFDAVESGGVIKFVPRGQSPVATIPEDDLASHDYGSEIPDQLPLLHQQEMELPVETNVKYPDKDAAYQVGAQQSRRLITTSRFVMDVEMAIAMDAAKARQIAEVLMFDAWTAANSLSLQLGTKYAYLEPTDVVSVVKGDITYTFRLTNSDSADGIGKFQAALEDVSIYTQAPPVQELLPADELITPDATPGQTRLELMDVPLLRDQDDGQGPYMAATGYLSGWRGAQVYKSADAGASYAAVGTGINNEAAIGNTLGVLGDFAGGNIFDELNTVSVKLVSQNQELSSATELSVLNGSNACLIGSEIVQFKTATLTAPKTYTLSGLLRGRKGTEWAMSTHATGDRFVLFSATTTYILPMSSSEYNLARLYKAPPFGTLLADAPAIEFTNTAVAQKPLSPVLVGGGRDASDNLTINWQRRTRIGGSWNGFEAPLGEATEEYEVDILDVYGDVLRTIEVTAETATYSAANQTSDGITPGDPIEVEVYQIGSYGRGYGASAII